MEKGFRWGESRREREAAGRGGAAMCRKRLLTGGENGTRKGLTGNPSLAKEAKRDPGEKRVEKNNNDVIKGLGKDERLLKGGPSSIQ